MRKVKKWLIVAVAVVAALSQAGVLPPVLAPVAQVLGGQLDGL
jgi:hypothetical protein